MRGGPPEHATIVYDYNYEKHKRYVDEWFEGFRGYIHMDADPFFETLLADSVNGAQAVCLHFSLIRTALAHKLTPYKYYKAILTRVPHCETVEYYEALLPWNIQL